MRWIPRQQFPTTLDVLSWRNYLLNFDNILFGNTRRYLTIVLFCIWCFPIMIEGNIKSCLSQYSFLIRQFVISFIGPNCSFVHDSGVLVKLVQVIFSLFLRRVRQSTKTFEHLYTKHPSFNNIELNMLAIYPNCLFVANLVWFLIAFRATSTDTIPEPKFTCLKKKKI